jgi:integrase
MGIFIRGRRLWARFKDAEGRWVNKATPYEVGQEGDAERYLARRIANAAAVREADERAGRPEGGPMQLREFAEKWLKERRALGVRSIADDESRMKRHILPRLGDLDLDQIQSRHVREFVIALRTKTTSKKEKLAPRTIRNVYGLISTMFRDAVAEGLIASTPCVLRRGVLPPKADKDPAWRATAIYTRGEIERLISERLIPEDRRVLYAIKGLAGLRHGEASSLRWRQYDATMEPLGSLSLEVTKTGVPRRVPVHPTLARVLAEWKLAGWERTFGRQPTGEDLVVPTRNGTERSRQEAPKALRLDLDALKLRARRGHDLRRTFITLAQVDGARRDLLETITHGPRGDIVSVYTTFPWPALCAEVQKLKIELREGDLVELPTTPLHPSRYTAVTGAERARRRWPFPVTPSGIEPEIAP